MCSCFITDLQNILINFMSKERKIIKNSFGEPFSVCFILFTLLCLFLSSYQMYYYYFGTQIQEADDIILKFSRVIRIPKVLKFKNNFRFILVAFGCFILSCLFQVYIILRVLIEPSFASPSVGFYVSTV